MGLDGDGVRRTGYLIQVRVEFTLCWCALRRDGRGLLLKESFVIRSMPECLLALICCLLLDTYLLLNTCLCLIPLLHNPQV
jgi:hypothetical protein